MASLSNNKFKAIKEISFLCFLAAAIIYFGRIHGTSTEVVLIRLAVLPLGLFAMLGLDAMYKKPIFTHTVTLKAVSYALLRALLISLFVFIITWNIRKSPAELMQGFLVMLIAFTAVTTLSMLFAVYRIKKQMLSQGTNQPTQHGA